MANSSPGDNKKTDSVEAETLKTRSDSEKVAAEPKDSKVNRSEVTDKDKKRRLSAYRPTHKATFIGLAVVVAILAINAGILGFLLQKESATQKSIDQKGVTISPSTLSKLGVNDTQIGSSNEELVINPAAQFNSAITVAGDVSIGGQLHLNSTLNASNAALSQLQAGNTTVSAININGAATASTLSVRNNMAVNGGAQFQNTVTIAKLLSVEGSAAVASNLSVGGELSASNVAAGNLLISGILDIGGHVMTAGATPAISKGSAPGSTGSVSISGNDESGTIFVSAGNGAGSGEVAYVAFHSGYSTVPSVVISPVGGYAEFYIGSVSAGGFSVSSALALSGSYQINYIVEQ